MRTATFASDVLQPLTSVDVLYLGQLATRIIDLAKRLCYPMRKKQATDVVCRR